MGVILLRYSLRIRENTDQNTSNLDTPPRHDTSVSKIDFVSYQVVLKKSDRYIIYLDEKPK